MQQTIEKKKMTRGTKKLIETAIDQLEPEKRNNSNAICEKMVDILFERFDGNNLDYQIKRMGIESTGQILDKLDDYFLRYRSHHPEDKDESTEV